MKELLISRCFGGFGFSRKFMELFKEEYGKSLKELCIDEDGDLGYPISIRSDEKVLELFKKVGTKFASGAYSELEIVEVESLEGLYIEDYDGAEYLAYEVVAK